MKVPKNGANEAQVASSRSIEKGQYDRWIGMGMTI